MKAYFDILWSSLKNRFSLHSVVRNKTSKQVPIAISWFFNGYLIWHLVNEAKTEVKVTQKRLLSKKKCLKWPNPSFEARKWIPMFYSFCVAILECLWGMLVGKIELKYTPWCLIEDARLVFGTTWIFPGVLVLQSCFSVKCLACLVFHPGFQLLLLTL